MGSRERIRPNVSNALDYLSKINSGERIVLGRKVVVIGGGSVAIDAARTARRLGSEDVHLVCLETRDLKSKDRMPALDWEIAEAEEEGIIIHPSSGINGSFWKTAGPLRSKQNGAPLCVNRTAGFNPQYDESADGEEYPGGKRRCCHRTGG